MNDTLFDRVISVTLSYDGALASRAFIPNWKEASRSVGPYRSRSTVAEMAAKFKNVRLKDLLESVQGNITIECTSGVKPNISFELEELPGNNVVGTTVTIRNWAMSRDLDIRKFNHMKIRAGYRTGPQYDFESTIFTSYQSKPNPGGEYVFKGVVVGKSGSNMFNNDTARVIHMNGNKLTVQELHTKFADVLGLTPVFNNVPDAVRNMVIRTEQDEYTVESGYALVTWWAAVVNKLNMTLTDMQVYPAPPDLSVTAWEDTLQLSCSIYSNERELTERCIYLKAVNQLSFEGPKLTLVAPWIPSLIPNSVFAVPTWYYQDSAVGNQLADTDIGRLGGIYGNMGLYRALIVKVRFSTVESVNQMEVTAVPFKYVPSTAVQTIRTNDRTAQEIEESTEAVTTEGVAETDVGTEEKLPSTDYVDITSIKLGAVGSKQRRIVLGDTLIGLTKEAMGSGKVVVTNAQLKDNPKHPASQYSNRIDANTLFPIVTLLTYNAAVVNPTNPNWLYPAGEQIRSPLTIQVGRDVMLPTGLSAEDFAAQSTQLGRSSLKKLFEAYAVFYAAQVADHSSLVRNLRLAADLMEDLK